MAEAGIAAAGVIAEKVGEEIYNQVQRTVTVRIKNDLEDELLNNPEILTRRGKIYTPPNDVHPQTEETLLFHKTPMSVFGTIGAFIYTLGDTQNRAVVFYANPFIGKNRFGLRWISTSDEFDLQSWISEYRKNRNRRDYVKDMWTVGDRLSNKEKDCSDGYVVRAFMTHGGHATLSVTLTKKGKLTKFNRNRTPDHHLPRTKTTVYKKLKRTRSQVTQSTAQSRKRKISASEEPDCDRNKDDSDIVSEKKIRRESSKKETANEKELESDVETECNIDDDDKFWESEEVLEVSVYEAL